MPKYEGVSSSVVRRLPRYYRFLTELLSAGITRISSAELSRTMGFTASQIRQDLNCFGGFGQQGYGYNVEQLQKEICRILGLDNALPMILVGAGNLGKAIARHMNFDSRGFKLTGIFDKDRDLIGTHINGVVVSDAEEMSGFCRANQPKVAVLCIPRENALLVAQELVSLGVKGFWNFSHYDLALHFKGVAVENVHLGDSLMTLSYEVNESLN